MKLIGPIFILCCILAGCSPRLYQDTASRIRRDTVFVERVQVDSVYRRDSIHILDRGDTVYQYVERWRDRYRYLHDTTFIRQTDTLKVAVHDVLEVERPLSRWQSFCIVLGRLAILALAAWLSFLVVRK